MDYEKIGNTTNVYTRFNVVNRLQKQGNESTGTVGSWFQIYGGA